MPGTISHTIHQLASRWAPEYAEASTILQLILEGRGTGVNLNPYPYGLVYSGGSFLSFPLHKYTIIVVTAIEKGAN